MNKIRENEKKNNNKKQEDDRLYSDVKEEENGNIQKTNNERKIGKENS